MCLGTCATITLVLWGLRGGARLNCVLWCLGGGDLVVEVRTVRLKTSFSVSFLSFSLLQDWDTE